MIDSTPLSFQKLRFADLPLLHVWLNSPAVMQWYSKRAYSFDEVIEKYAPYINNQTLTHSFVILYRAMSIGYIQTYQINDYPDYSAYVQAGEDAAGVDLFIGDEQYLHKGLGSLILTAFLREVVFATSDVQSCIIGPEPKNTAAIRAYEKAGFTYLKTIQLPDEPEPEYLMRIAR